MKKAFSIFIMDVTNSSKFENGLELTNYLSFWEKTLNEMKGFFNISAKHRMGDEIICVVDNHYTALMISYYMIYNWKYKDFMPYFGIALGERDGEITDIDVWNHPIIKKARQANEKIKKDANRESLIALEVPSNFTPLAIDLDILFTLQTNLIINQTDKQREILGLYSLLNSQKKIADLLNKRPPTISNHFKKGHVEIILRTSENILSYLRMGQIKCISEETEKDVEHLTTISTEFEEVNQQIKEYLLMRLRGVQ
ncbi:hypothetical protein [Bacillus sp. SN10]|uniref:hypothetical protein n=1 Tax=Bacillus sp. SN10 TaxID=2056493 RepID=UPI000C33DF94|nr:hypothetical protein [Bacillus sp. SN10]PKJ52142.1 hypothetical protein CWE34_29495 [Bacillus sp. SN10]